MSLNDYINYYIYFQTLNKSMIKNKIFHFLFLLLDIIILILKILNIYHSNYNTTLNKSKMFQLTSFFSNYKAIFQLLPLIIYLTITYIILIIYILSKVKKIKKIDKIAINIFEFLFVRLLFIFYCEFLFNLNSLYFLLFLFLSIPFLAFIFVDINFLHLTGFMIQDIIFPFDNFTSLCDKQKTTVF